jgi:hypothetical protein
MTKTNLKQDETQNKERLMLKIKTRIQEIK